MKRGLLISFYIIAAVLLLALAVSGCSQIPSMKYCEKVMYKRDGSKVKLEAECNAPIGGI